MADIKKQIKQIEEKIIKSAQDWLDNKSKSVDAEVAKILEDSRKKIVISLLGFKYDHFDGFVVDHCNGRGGESAIGDKFRRMHAQAVEKWLSDLTPLPKLTTTEIKHIQTEYRRGILSALEFAAKRRGETEAAKIIDDILNANLPTTAADKIDKEIEAARDALEQQRIAEAVRAAEAKVHAKYKAEAEAKAKAEAEAKAKLEAAARKDEETRTLHPEL